MKEYRVKVPQLWVGVSCTAFFALAAVGTVVAALWNVDGSLLYPVGTAIVGGLFWGAWTLLGIWIVADYVRGRLVVSEDGIVQMGVIWSRGIEFEDVEVARWRKIPVGGSLQLRGASARMTIEFGSFSLADRMDLIARLRTAIPAQRQGGWEEFTQPEKKFEASPRASFVTSLALAGFFLGFAGLPWLMARQGFVAGPQLVALAAMNLAGVVFCLWMAVRAWRRLRSGSWSEGRRADGG